MKLGRGAKKSNQNLVGLRVGDKKRKRKFSTTYKTARLRATRRRGGSVADRGAHAAARDEFSLGRNRANRTGIPARLERVINTPERNS
jgi:hypothetical protein